ncbi:formin-like protein 1 [Amblyraja radiata]|uniref:formin-like protein 1 n=1 Tax=Amblyraja radiata TaxID=386614 RepID=UPI0014035B3D|nr:formin-like protein 1 [Amblyraja radiata]
MLLQKVKEMESAVERLTDEQKQLLTALALLEEQLSQTRLELQAARAAQKDMDSSMRAMENSVKSITDKETVLLPLVHKLLFGSSQDSTGEPLTAQLVHRQELEALLVGLEKKIRSDASLHRGPAMEAHSASVRAGIIKVQACKQPVALTLEHAISPPPTPGPHCLPLPPYAHRPLRLPSPPPIAGQASPPGFSAAPGRPVGLVLVGGGTFVRQVDRAGAAPRETPATHSWKSKACWETPPARRGGPGLRIRHMRALALDGRRCFMLVDGLRINQLVPWTMNIACTPTNDKS